MKSMNLLSPKGKGKGTYYVPGDELSTSPQELSTPAQDLSTPAIEISAPPKISDALKKSISELKQREHDNEKVEKVKKYPYFFQKVLDFY
jgi:ATP-dependent DNA helicase RecG